MVHPYKYHAERINMVRLIIMGWHGKVAITHMIHMLVNRKADYKPACLVKTWFYTVRCSFSVSHTLLWFESVTMGIYYFCNKWNTSLYFNDGHLQPNASLLP